MSKDEVILLDFWGSPFAMRVKIALAEKGVEYESREEHDLLGKKSELLLKSNPIYKKVPVFIHNGKVVCESVIILNYIEETWPSPSLLPACPYGRSQARFWSDFIDKKVFEGGSKIWNSKGEAQVEAVKEFIGIVKVLEGALGDKDFFGGDSFGFIDVVAIPLTSWFYAYEQCGGFKLEDDCPKITAWMNRCMQKETVAKVIPDPTKVYELVCMLKKMFGID
ncbi:probable glutathione S-transferase [Magnolia sinica]|uniref:probable glutathione S-transferase n=1 Tax=Magnolia sinica TaxID=86752 RepID=UPI002658A8BB|nr:probable glutathione S-transferase [Magnolia sinica]